MQPETRAGLDAAASRSIPPGQPDQSSGPTAGRAVSPPAPVSEEPTAGTTVVNVNDPGAAYRVAFASVLDHEALVDLRGDETDFPGFEAARDFAVDVLEGILELLRMGRNSRCRG